MLIVMKRNIFIGIVASFLLISLIACSIFESGHSDTVRTYVSATVKGEEIRIPVEINTINKAAENNSFVNSTIFDKDLALISLVMASKTGSEKKIRGFFSELELDNIVCSANYDKGTADSISYCIGHYKVEGYDLIAVAVRGIDYDVEWASNFKIGSSGDHQGFTEAATQVYNGLTSYINSKYRSSYDSGKILLLMTGYSRGAAVADVLSYLVLADPVKKLNIPQKQVAAYTFGTPRGLCAEHAIAFPNVFNLYTSADVVTYIAPEIYGMYRCGIDIDIYDPQKTNYTRMSTKEEKGKYIDETVWYESRVDKLAKENKKSIPKFRLESFNYKKGKTPGASTIEYGISEKSSIEWLLNLIMTDGGIADTNKGYSFKTREKFASTIQPYFAYLIQYLLGYPEIVEEIGEKFEKDPVSMPLRWTLQSDGIYTDVKEILDKYKISYNDAELKKACTALFDMIDLSGGKGCLTNTLVKLIPSAVAGNQDLSRMVYLHMPDMALIMLLDYLK